MSVETSHIIRVFYGTGIWAVIARIISFAALIFINSILAREMETGQFGAFLLTQSLIISLSLFSNAGLNTAISRMLGMQYSEKKDINIRPIIVQCFSIVCVAVVLVASLVYSSIGDFLFQKIFDAPMLINLSGAIAIWLIFHSLQLFLVETLRGLKKINHANILSASVSQLIVLVCIILAAHLNYGITIEFLVSLFIYASLFVVIVSIVIIMLNTNDTKATEHSSISEILCISFPMLVTNMTFVILTYADLWIVGLIMSKTNVAIYAIALQLAAIVNFPIVILNSVIPAYISEYTELKNHSELQYSIRKLTGYISYLAISIFLLLALFSDTILELIYGEFFNVSVPFLIILGLGRLINVVCGPCGLVLLMTGNQVTMMYLNIFTGILTLITVYIFAQNFGLIGIAIASSLCMLVQNIFMVYFAYKKANILTIGDLNIKRLLTK